MLILKLRLRRFLRRRRKIRRRRVLLVNLMLLRNRLFRLNLFSHPKRKKRKIIRKGMKKFIVIFSVKIFQLFLLKTKSRRKFKNQPTLLAKRRRKCPS